TLESQELIEASIQQKSEQIAVVPISNAIDYKQNKRYLPYLIPPVIILLAILLVAPGILSEASERLLQPTTNFTPPAPFNFVLQNKDLNVPMYGSITIKTTTEGNKQPENMYIIIDGAEIEMEKNDKKEFQYTVNRLLKNTTFNFYAAGISSAQHQINIIEKPILEGFEVNIIYPKHTAKPTEKMSSL